MREKTVGRFNSLVQRVSDELVHHNEPLAMRLRVEWVRVRAKVRKLIPERREGMDAIVDVVEEYYDLVDWAACLTEDDAPQESRVETDAFVGYGPQGEEVWL